MSEKGRKIGIEVKPIKKGIIKQFYTGRRYRFFTLAAVNKCDKCVI